MNIVMDSLDRLSSVRFARLTGDSPTMNALCRSATKNTVKPTVSASTRKEPVSLGLVGAFIALSVVVLIGVVLSIIIICRMKRKIKNLKAMKCLTHGGEVGQAFERKTDDNLHDKKENVNEQRDLLEKNARKKDTNLEQPPKHSERRNRTDEIINPNPLAESLEAEVQNILEEEKVQEGDDNDTGDYPDLSALPEMDERKIQTNDFKGSSAKTV
ncbi:hypothetical protein CHS0354_004093 [Potamilus streckersoni]|uniref:Uncharacterized protein n=1 Tax=Potamilus streckersoni TaxID=2493646 RepID=A0AAE0SJY4_9BIVA|nr:hypothetical protein CHS0354_004093 [Potamilus streckersoni]